MLLRWKGSSEACTIFITNAFITSLFAVYLAGFFLFLSFQQYVRVLWGAPCLSFFPSGIRVETAFFSAAQRLRQVVPGHSHECP